MRVQAKRISLPKETFRRLQTYKAARQPKRQIETLITSARADKLNPAYCLYVYSRRWPQIGPWPAFWVGSTAASSPLGCLVGHAGAIRAVGSDALSKLAPVLFPWHLMVCVCATSAPGTSAAQQAFRLLSASMRASPDAFSDDAADDSDVIDDTPAMFEPVSALPSYMMRLREVSALDRAGAVDELMVEARALDRGIRGLVLIRAGDRRCAW